MKKMKKIVKNEKAISPVLAVLLMIAVAVAAALVTYAWVMTYLSSTTGRAGHAMQIQSVEWVSGTEVKIYAQNVGDGTIIITDTYLDGALIIADITMTPVDGNTEEGATTSIAIGTQIFTDAQDVHIKVVCDDGTFTSGTYTVEDIV